MLEELFQEVYLVVFRIIFGGLAGGEHGIFGELFQGMYVGEVFRNMLVVFQGNMLVAFFIVEIYLTLQGIYLVFRNMLVAFFIVGGVQEYVGDCSGICWWCS
jgi:hypothetical protein